MKFNAFVWNNFIESEKGRASIEFFSDYQSKHKKFDKKLIEFMTDWASQGMLGYTNSAKEDIEKVLLCLDEIEDSENEKLLPKKIQNRKDAERYFQELADIVVTDEDDNDQCLFALDEATNLSIALHCKYPDYFFPYYFKLN